MEVRGLRFSIYFTKIQINFAVPLSGVTRPYKSPFPFALLKSESDLGSVTPCQGIFYYNFYNIELLCIYFCTLLYCHFFVINLFSVIYKKDVENVFLRVKLFKDIFAMFKLF